MPSVQPASFIKSDIKYEIVNVHLPHFAAISSQLSQANPPITPANTAPPHSRTRR